MRATVDSNQCIGCGLCVELCPAVFNMSDDVTIVKTDPIPSALEMDCEEAKDQCPAEAIAIQ